MKNDELEKYTGIVKDQLKINPVAKIRELAIDGSISFDNIEIPFVIYFHIMNGLPEVEGYNVLFDSMGREFSGAEKSHILDLVEEFLSHREDYDFEINGIAGAKCELTDYTDGSWQGERYRFMKGNAPTGYSFVNNVQLADDIASQKMDEKYGDDEWMEENPHDPASLRIKPKYQDEFNDLYDQAHKLIKGAEPTNRS